MTTLHHAPRQDRSRATLAAIVKATEDLLGERPFAEVSIAQIVAAAGCTTGSFYARFESKEALLPYLYEKYDAALHARFEAIGAAYDWAAMSLRQTVETLVAVTVQSYGERPHLMREIMLFARRSPGSVTEDMRQRRAVLHAAMIDLIARHGAEITHPDPRRAAAFADFAMTAAARELILFSHTPMNSSSPLEREALEAELVRLALGYLQAPSRSAS